ncbi:sterol-4-alpha-carboxylate 3-dehydrogenase, decarboxylating [Spathaspora passalidarum NRRL Y-27907]|uniref:Sterol-4-alpha-carboxylate 3-dehydrogenase ERG26, decarboxylating n=1 Tax=Spathaspora passalidarum (strain NRRL Y-27907 / 11-Y1) TaxID=619300 RepID=G3AE59_SPAPN|nr:sterol-4-alpha-carboxylate 3-dehydrogenase, decarboxylating [Spathaspora passalidarum NRRL Y-27907]EGW35593.1 sterol-4-alpha-carboxylate 3-dehydrogenase, decarboxylating [Spathaspora passalidarum NRRL Y-27907]
MTKSPLNSVLLVGGSGFLGLHLIEQFHRHCPETKITIFDIRPLPEKLSQYFTFNPSQIHFIKGDLTAESDVSNAITSSECDVIVHAASPMHGLPQEIYEKVNVEGTKNLLAQAKKLGVKAFVYTSSAGVIFNGQDVYNGDESWPYPDVHMDGYNETKAIAETAVMNANDPAKGFLTVCLRPAGIFGPGDRQLVPGLRASAKLGQSKYQLGDNNNLFDWTYVGNVADAHVLAATKILDPEFSQQLGGETFFITNDAPTYFWTLARTVWKADGYVDKYYIKLSRPVAIVLGYFSEFFSKLAGKEPGITPFRVKVVCATRYHNISKAKTILGYKPAVDLETGIKYTLDWMNEDI